MSPWAWKFQSIGSARCSCLFRFTQELLHYRNTRTPGSRLNCRL